MVRRIASDSLPERGHSPFLLHSRQKKENVPVSYGAQGTELSAPLEAVPQLPTFGVAERTR